MTSLDQARELVRQITEVDAPGVHVTLDATEVYAHARGGVILVQLEKITYPAWSPAEPETSFQVHIIAGPHDQPLAAWQRIDAITGVLHAGGLNIATATPTSFAPGTGPALPAFTLDLNPLD